MYHSDPMSFPSKLTGNVLRLLLLIAVMIYAIVAVCTVIYVADYAVYEQYLAAIDGPAMLFGGILYYIIVVVFLIWIIHVHRAIKQCHPQYPISVAGGIVRMLPLVNIWGIGSTFANISDYFFADELLRKAAVLIQRMVLPLYLVIFVGNGLNRYILRNSVDASDGVILAGAFVDLMAVAVYWLLTHTIHHALTHMYAMKQEEPHSESTAFLATEEGANIEVNR